ncbi:MAG: cupin domain-containing protein [Chthoniobacterales bacterium]
MHDRASKLISDLDLQPHPEGGYFREIFRSSREVQPLDERSARSALTTIYFMLGKGQHSRWHRVASDEVWHFYEGDPLELYWIDGHGQPRHEVLGTSTSNGRSVCVIPAGCWQAARPLGAFSLVGCTVAPGFEFQDFEIATAGSAALAQITSLGAGFAKLA